MSAATITWDRVVAAVDLDGRGLGAALTAAALMPAGATLTLCAVEEPQPGAPAPRAAAGEPELAAVERALATLVREREAELHLRCGAAAQRILEELHGESATLVTLGPGSGGAGAQLGAVTAAVLHEAPCAVLIAGERPLTGAGVVVGYDGSGAAQRALAVAGELARRSARELRVLVALGDPGSPGHGWWRGELGAELDVHEDPQTALSALVQASSGAELLVLGSRHLTGALAHRSVSEHVAAQARCPVLVVR